MDHFLLYWVNNDPVRSMSILFKKIINVTLWFVFGRDTDN